MLTLFQHPAVALCAVLLSLSFTVVTLYSKALKQGQGNDGVEAVGQQDNSLVLSEKDNGKRQQYNSRDSRLRHSAMTEKVVELNCDRRSIEVTSNKNNTT